MERWIRGCLWLTSPRDVSPKVFDAVAAELAANEVYIVLDNHMSQGAWCCNTEDGNSWWGDTYFSVANWTRGLAYMADHVSLVLELSSREPHPSSHRHQACFVLTNLSRPARGRP